MKEIIIAKKNVGRVDYKKKKLPFFFSLPVLYIRKVQEETNRKQLNSIGR